MKPAPFAYHAPRSLQKALDLLASLENPRLLAGGQSLMPMLNYRLAAPDHLIDLGSIEELRGIDAIAGGLSIGSMTTQRTIENSTLAAKHCPLLVEALSHVGHQTTRNRGTIGGSLCHLDPAAELPLVSQVLEPTLTIVGSAGRRQIPFAEFPLGHLATTLDPHEILTRVEFPTSPTNTYTAFEEFARRPGDFAIVATAVQVTIGATGLVADARISVGGIEVIAIRLRDAERMLIGQPWNSDRIQAVLDNVEDHPAEGDHNNSAEYKQHLAKVLIGRALARIEAKLEVVVA